MTEKGIRSGTLERKSKRENEGPECFFFKALKTGNITDLYVETQKIVVTIWIIKKPEPTVLLINKCISCKQKDILSKKDTNFTYYISKS